MTETDLAVLALLFGALLFAGVRHLLELGPEPITPDPVPAYVYKPRVHSRGPILPHRPEGMQSLKAEIALTPEGRHRAEDLVAAPPVNLHPIKDHDDWRFSTDEYRLTFDRHFEGQPNDQAVQRVWAGAGR